MDNLARWITGSVAGIVGLFGLFFAAHAETAVLYWLGMALALLAVVVVFVLIKRSFDELDARRAHGGTDESRH